MFWGNEKPVGESLLLKKSIDRINVNARLARARVHVKNRAILANDFV